MQIVEKDKQQLVILGATGSIGISTLDVVRQHESAFAIYALTTNQNEALLFEQCLAYRPKIVVLVSEKAASFFSERVQQFISESLSESDKKYFSALQIIAGSSALVDIVAHASVDIVMAAIVGAAGLPATLAAANAGKRVLLANKEALVISGNLFMSAVRQSGAQLLPIDSEHNAVFQCMPFSKDKRQPVLSVEQKSEIKKVILTASGGPFWQRNKDDFADVTPEEACKHPKWDMGRKISVDSATLMNKGLEVIEACLLFDLKPEQVEVLIHPQSIVHSMVEYIDGSVIAQLANPDMKIPIAYGLSWPKRIASGVEFLDLLKEQPLQFFSPDLQKFPCLALAYRALSMGNGAATVLNAANEVAVQAFLDKRLAFGDIPILIEKVLSTFETKDVQSLDEILEQDRKVRLLAEKVLNSLARTKTLASGEKV